VEVRVFSTAPFKSSQKDRLRNQIPGGNVRGLIFSGNPTS
jgi:hypothetical protein